jgi:hypothetical protein
MIYNNFRNEALLLKKELKKMPAEAFVEKNHHKVKVLKTSHLLDQVKIKTEPHRNS